MPGQFFGEKIFKRNINYCFYGFLCLNFPSSKLSWFALIFYQYQHLAKFVLIKTFVSLAIIFQNWPKIKQGLSNAQAQIVPRLKDFVCYIFASLFYLSKWEYLWNNEKGFLFYFESSFRSGDNQVLTFQIFKCYDIIKYLSMKHETHITE